MPSVDELREQVRARRQELRDAEASRRELELEKSDEAQKAALQRELDSLDTEVAYENAALALLAAADDINKSAENVAGFESTEKPNTTPPPPSVDDKSSDDDPLASLRLGDSSSDDDDEKEGK